jgi:hypothetical protein
MSFNRSRTFKYNNNRPEPAYYNVTVSVKTIRDNSHYDIQYTYAFHLQVDPTYLEKSVKFYENAMHPFYLRGGITQYTLSKERDSTDGVIIAKNELTETMVRFLCMTDKELSEHCNEHINVQTLRRNIMITLCFFCNT